MSGYAIVISSCLKNAAAREKLVESLLPQAQKRGVDIVVVIGGCEESRPLEKLFIPAGHSFYVAKCTHNSFDLTALIELSLLPKTQWMWYFLMHDTCLAGPKCVDKLLYARPPLRNETSSLAFPSMNIGWYCKGVIAEYASWLKDQRCTYPHELQQYKAGAVETEDYIFKQQRHKGLHHIFGTLTRVSYSNDGPYGTGIGRRIEYYECLDLYKYKANWHVKDVYELGM